MTRAIAFAGLALGGCNDGSDPGPEPRIEFVSPTDDTTYRGGESIRFEARAVDREDGELAPSAMAWWVDFHHDDHTHPASSEAVGSTGSLEVPTSGEVSSNVFFRFHVRATDSDGHVVEATQDVAPRLSHLSFVTEPPGLTILLDGQPRSTPFAVDSVEGILRSIGASAQDHGGRGYELASISDGGASPHDVTTPDDDTTYTFTFVDVGAANAPPSCVLGISGPATVGAAVTLTATVADTDGDVVAVTFYDGDTAIAPAVTAGPFTLSWTPTTAGPHTLVARARDDDGAVTSSAPLAITVAGTGTDATPPTCTLTAPAAYATGLTGSIGLTATAADDVGVVGVQFQIDGKDLGAEDTSPPYAGTLPATNAYSRSQHVFRARARDAAGNVSAWSSVVVSFGGSTQLESGFSYSTLVNSLSDATAMTIAPDGRIFVCQQNGQLRIVANGALLATPFVSISVNSSGERGLLGVALDPDFATNQYVYVYHTVPDAPIHNRVSRLVANGNVASGSPTPIWDLPNLSTATNHNGGAIHFGTDGYLYVAVGDNANSANAQNPATQLGKLLRITSTGAIPTSNPFYGTTTGNLRAIFASGLRNPFSFAIHPGTGRIHVNDVGENTYEEVNLVSPGANFGWPTTEGRFDPDAHPTFTNPIFAYGHGSVPVATSGTFFSGVAIVGATFYAPASPTFPSAYQGDYFFGDYTTSFVARYDVESGTVSAFATPSAAVIDLATAPDGSLYLLGRGTLARISAP